MQHWLLKICFFVVGLVAATAVGAQPSDHPPELGELDDDSSLEGLLERPVSPLDYSLNELLQIDVRTLEKMMASTVQVGSDRPVSVMKIPAAVSVISREDIAAFGVRSLDELVLLLPATFETAHEVRPLNMASFRLRSADNVRGYIVMVNDYVMREPVNANGEVFPLPISAVERLEFLRGPASVLYGSDAIFGAYRLVTTPSVKAAAQFTATYDPAASAHDLTGRIVQTFDVLGRPLLLHVAAQYQHDDERYLQVTDAKGDVGKHALGAQRQLGFAEASYGDFTLRLNASRHAGVMLGSLAGAVVGNAANEQTTYHVYTTQLAHSKTVGPVHLESFVAYAGREMVFSVGRIAPLPDALLVPTRSNTLTGQSSAALDYEWLKVSLGIKLEREIFGEDSVRFIGAKDRAELLPIHIHPDSKTADVFGQAGLVYGAWQLLGAYRLNYFAASAKNVPNFTKSQMNPPPILTHMGKLALVYSPSDDLAIRAMVSRTFQSPPILGLFGNIPGFATANPMLQPQLLNIAELSADLQISKRWVSRFYSYYAVLLERQDVEFVTAASNKEESGIYYGADWIQEVTVSSWLSLTQSLTLQDTRHLPKQYNLIAKLRGVAKLLDGALLVAPSFHFLLESPIKKSRFPIRRNIAVLDLSVHYNLAANWSLVATVRNAFNDDTPFFYEGIADAYGSLQDGRIARLGVRATF